MSTQQAVRKTPGVISVVYPTTPSLLRQSVFERRIADPSSAKPNGKCYPIPGFFEYRAQPTEVESI